MVLSTSTYLGGKATGTYRFLNGLYGLTNMPATFQKPIGVKLRNCQNKFAFLDDTLVIKKELDKILYLLDIENRAIKLQKREFTKTEIVWLDFKISPTGITPNGENCKTIDIA